MSSRPYNAPRIHGLSEALATQSRVIGALIMREIHTRYGRDNIGYLWLIGEPLMLATVITGIHGATGHTPFGSDVKPVPFALLGYTTFIIFRGIVNRAEGTLESNAPLLYHRMVTVFDIIMARTLLESTGVFMSYVVLMVVCVALGLADPPARPLYLLAGQASMVWMSWAQSMIVTALTHDNPLMSRLTHPYTYLCIPISGAFFQLSWVPNPYRYYLSFAPLTNIFELVRYGQFESCNLDNFNGYYLYGLCLVLTWIGLVALRMARRRLHLS
jgi:capsular polysaccharide transport system permease protein